MEAQTSEKKTGNFCGDNWHVDFYLDRLRCKIESKIIARYVFVTSAADQAASLCHELPRFCTKKAHLLTIHVNGSTPAVTPGRSQDGFVFS